MLADFYLLSNRSLLQMALWSLSRLVSGSTTKSLLGLAGESRTSVLRAPRNAPLKSSVRRLAVAATQDQSAGTREGLDERPSQGRSLSKHRDSGKHLRPIDPLLELWDPFANRSLKDTLTTIDRMIDGPLFRTPVPRMRLPHDLIEDEDAYKLRIDMPGLTKDEVKVMVENGQLVIQGEKKVDDKSDEGWATAQESYSTRLILPENVELDEVKAELKNGVLRVVIPKSKEEPKAIPIEVQ